MEILMVIFAYAAPLFVGFVGITLLDKKRGGLALTEKLALSYALGTGFLSFYMFYLGLLRIRFTRGSVAILFGLAVLTFFLIIKKRGFKNVLVPVPRRQFGRLSSGAKILVLGLSALLLWKVIFIGFMILSKPTYFDDSVSNYNYKAKNFYYNRALVLNPDHPDFLGGHEPRYPDMNPLFKTWVSLCLGEWKEYAVNLNTLFYFLALGLIMYHNLARIISPSISLIFTYLLLSIPLLTFHAGFAHMDLIVSFYSFGGLVYLFRWIREKDRFAFLISALLFGVGISAKDEVIGLFIGGALPVLILYQLIQHIKLWKILRTTGIYLGIVLFLNIPWFVVKKVYNLASGPPENYRKFEFHPEAFSILGSYMFSSGNFNILWTVFFCTLIFSYSTICRTELKYILVSLSGSSMIILGLFIFTPFFEFLRIGTTINRALLSLLPIIILYIAVYYGKISQTNVPSPRFWGNELETKRS